MQPAGKRQQSRDDGDEVIQGKRKRDKNDDHCATDDDENDDGEDDEDDEDLHIGKLSKEAEVFALQAMHTSLLQKMAEVGRLLSGVMKENRVYKKVLRDHMGQNEDDVKRAVEIQVMRAMRNNEKQNIGDAEATIIAAAALGKNLNSPADALQDILKLYRYAPAPMARQQAEMPATPPVNAARTTSMSDFFAAGTAV
jgi:hypothetical protein